MKKIKEKYILYAAYLVHAERFKKLKLETGKLDLTISFQRVCLKINKV